jgi:catechol 2,3-dioxygenase-like lactoylglutathione lyase family enzyme
MLCEVPVSIDHLALPAADAQASARWFAEILGLAAPLPDGPDEDMFNVRLNDSSSVLFVASQQDQVTMWRLPSAPQSSRQLWIG